jgi:hypothetical protein
VVYDRPVQNPTPRSRSILRAFACVFLVFHLAAVTVDNLPRTTTLGAGIHAPFDVYLGVVQLWQGWDMFTTIPHFASMDGDVLVADVDGSHERVGPIVPGLEPFRKDPRMYSLFLRLAFSADGAGGFALRYRAAVCRALAAKLGHLPKAVGFDLRTEQLRSIADVQRDGRIGEPKTFHYDEAACPNP